MTAASATMERVARPGRLTSAQRSAMVSEYASGVSTPVLAEKYGIAHQTVGYHVKKLGAMRTASAAHTRYELRHDAFDDFSDRDAAYWLGFLLADGHIETRPGNKQAAVRLMLAERDVEHLEKFRAFLGYGGPVRHSSTTVKGKTYPTAVLVVGSNRLSARVREAGKYQDHIPETLARSVDFWRGVVDGDGTLGMYEREALKKYEYGIQPSLELVGGKHVVASFRGFMTAHGLTEPGIHALGEIYRVSWGWHQAREAMRILYAGAPDAISLSRKKAVALAALDQPGAGSAPSRGGK